MKPRKLAPVMLLAAFTAPLAAQSRPVMSTFDTGADGWACASTTNGTPVQRPSGGNPGGFLFVDNNEVDVVWCSAPGKFLGNLSGFNGGSFSFDGNLLLDRARYWTEEEAAPYGGNYGTVRITGPAGSVSIDLVAGKPASSWQTHSAVMSSSRWGTGETRWRAILASVTSIEINLEALYGEEQEGLDNVVLTAPGELSIVQPQSMPNGLVGERWIGQTLVSGGSPPFTWSVEGNLPTGAQMDPAYAADTTMAWTGLLLEAGTFNFTIVVVDSARRIASRSYQVTVAASGNPVLSLSSDNKRQGIPVDEVWITPARDLLLDGFHALAARLGQPPYRYSWDFPSPSMQLDPQSGLLSGKIPAFEFASETTISVAGQVQDANGNTGRKSFVVRVLFLPTPTDGSFLPNATVGQPYQFQFHATYGGGPGFYRWSKPFPSSILPPGLAIDEETGLLSGTPTAAGDYEMQINVASTAFGFRGATRDFSLRVLPAPSSPSPGAKLNTSRVSCDAVRQGAPGSTAPVTSTGGDLGLDTTGAASWLRTPTSAPSTPGAPRPGFHTLLCDPGALLPGQYKTEFRISGKTVVVDFTVGIPAPVIQPVPRKISVRLQTGGKPVNLVSQFRLNLGDLPTRRVATVETQPFQLKVSTEKAIQAEAPATITTEIDPAAVPPGHTSTSIRVEVPGVGISSLPVDLYRTPAPTPVVRPLGFSPSFPSLSVSERQSVYLTNPSPVLMPWTAKTQGPAAATVSPPSGTLAPGATQELDIRVSPPPAGTSVSSGTVQIQTESSTREVSFTVQRPPAPFAQMLPATLTFAARGSTQQASLRNLSTTTQTWLCHIPAAPGFSFLPASGSLAAGASALLTVTANPPGTSLTETDAVCQVGESVTTLHLAALPTSPSCTPGRLLVLPETPSANAVVQPGKTYPVQAVVRDNCGKTIDNAFVALLHGQDSTLLDFVGNGRYAGEWTPASLGSNPLSLTATAGPLSGQASLFPQVLPDSDGQPRLETGAPRGAAGLALDLTPAAGSLLSLFGLNLAAQPVAASTIPLPAVLAETSVTLGGQPLPLLYVSPSQINALVPHDLPKFVPLELIIRRGERRSAALTVTVGDAVPDLFTFDDAGVTRGILLDANFRLITGAGPLPRGSVGILLATGLGDVAPALGPNQQTASNARILISTASLSVGGWNAPILFAGLLPGFPGVYQINFRVPEKLEPGSHAVLLTVKGRTSNSVATEIE